MKSSDARKIADNYNLTNCKDKELIYQKIISKAKEGLYCLFIDSSYLSQDLINELRKNKYVVTTIYNDSDYESRVVGYEISW